MERSQLSRLGIPTLDVCFATIFHDALILRSQNAPRRAATASEAWFVCWRGGESDGEIQGPSQALVLHFPPIQKRLLDLCIATKMENSLHWRKQTNLMEYMFMKSALYDS
ncbi:uncharacterized protein LOC122007145 isoform X3 [Zingiber officinale]|uniref:uncharacterized protein LOC122007145 isoform X3 n=1 Tax=Zingiber officinale TaxID=94328 RepID=UPI001C4D21AE|nr:uncharacterized protein LOC122007145 isoform X3 [Zingiber officinale]